MDLNSSGLFSEWYGNNSLSEWEYRFTGTFLCVTAMTSIVGNILVLIAVMVYPCLRTATNVLLLGLLATDVLMVLACFPLTATATLLNRWPFGVSICHTYGFFGMLSGYASLGMLMLISIDRYIHVCQRHIAESSLMKHYGLMILCVWLNAGVWAVMPLTGWSGYGVEPSQTACTITWWNNDHLFQSYVITVFFLCYLLPVVVICYCYAKCMHFIAWVGSGDIRHENVEWTNEKDVTKMCLLCVVGFFTTWTPYAILCLWATFGHPGDIPIRFVIVAELCAKSSVMINPIIYFSTNRRWRYALGSLFLRRKQINADCQPVQLIALNSTTYSASKKGVLL